MVRSLNLRDSKHDATDWYKLPESERVGGMIYIKSDTLYLCLWHTDRVGFTVMSLARKDDGQLSECHRLYYQPDGLVICAFMSILRGDTLFCSHDGALNIQVCRANIDRSLKHCARINLPKPHRGFELMLLGNELRLATAFYWYSVDLFRIDLEAAELVQLSSMELNGAVNPLFCECTLLLTVDNNFVVQEAVSFTTIHGRLENNHQIIRRENQFNMERWYFVEGTLFAWNYASAQLLLFNIS